MLNECMVNDGWKGVCVYKTRRDCIVRKSKGEELFSEDVFSVKIKDFQQPRGPRKGRNVWEIKYAQAWKESVGFYNLSFQCLSASELWGD